MCVFSYCCSSTILSIWVAGNGMFALLASGFALATRWHLKPWIPEFEEWKVPKTGAAGGKVSVVAGPTS